MNGKTTKSSVSSGELKVQNVSEREIKDLEKMNGYAGVTIAGIEMGVTERNVVEITDSNSGASDTTNSGNKTSKYIIVGNSIIMKFREKIQDIINGVTLKVKGNKDKDKEEEEKAKEEEEEKAKATKKKVVKKVVKKAPQKSAEEQEK